MGIIKFPRSFALAKIPRSSGAKPNYLFVKSRQLRRLRRAQRTFTVCVCSERPFTALGTCFYGRSFKHVSRWTLELTLCSISGIGHFAGYGSHWEYFWVERKWGACHSFSIKQNQSRLFFLKLLVYLLTGVFYFIENTTLTVSVTNNSIIW